MNLAKLTLKDRKLFNKFLSSRSHELSVYAFENIYIWSSLYNIYWASIHGYLCVFFRDRIGCFLYLPPLGKEKNPQTLAQAFKIMDKFNKNNEISRIENVEEADTSFYQDLGYICQKKSYDYLCLRQDLINLRGNQFKSKRASANYFAKNYHFEYLPFAFNNRGDCLKLYDKWMSQRKVKAQEPLYQGMLEDSRKTLKVLLDNYNNLSCLGSIVKIDGELKAFSFGFKLNSQTFCILYEITDLSVKGLAQFIFREFSRELQGYKYVNIMDDSGLENLKTVKLSYHPVRLLPSFIVTRNHAN